MRNTIEKEPSGRRGLWKLTAASIVVVTALTICSVGCTASKATKANQAAGVTIEQVWALTEQDEGHYTKDVLPADVPEYPGWRGAITDHSDGVRSVSASTFDDPSKVIAFYSPRLEEAGWKVSQPARELPLDKHGPNSMMCSFLKDNRGVILYALALRPQASLAAHTSIDIAIYDSVPDDFFGPDKVFAPKPANLSGETSTRQSKTN